MIRPAEGRRPGLRAKHSVKGMQSEYTSRGRDSLLPSLAVGCSFDMRLRGKSYNIQARRFWEDRSAGSLSKS